MGCTSSTGRRASKKTVREEIRDHDEEMYLNLRRRYGMPNQHKDDGYEFGLCVKDNIGGMYSSYIGTAKATNEKVSIKQFMVQRYDPKLIVQEVANLARLSHESFPKVLELFHTDTSVYMITTYVDIFRLKNLVDLRNNTTTLTLPEVRKVFKSLVSAVQHCHDQQFLLRALLPDNIMVVRNGNPAHPTGSNKNNKLPDIDVKICDIAMGVQLTKANENIFSDNPLFDWTQIPFVAPEVALKLPYSFPCDYWCLGVILFMMISATMPFSVDDPMDRALLLQRVKDAEYSFNNPIWEDVRAEIKQIIRNLLVSDPMGRSNLQEIRKNSWLLQG